MGTDPFSVLKKNPQVSNSRIFGSLFTFLTGAGELLRREIEKAAEREAKKARDRAKIQKEKDRDAERQRLNAQQGQQNP